MMTSHNPNRSLVHIFCLSLSGLLVLYSAIAVYDLVTRESATAAELAAGVGRIALGLLLSLHRIVRVRPWPKRARNRRRVHRREWS